MKSAYRPAIVRLTLAVALLLACLVPSFAQQVGPSGLPLPRFVSLGAAEVNVRVGAGADYPIAWTFVRRGWPVEVTAEFDNWRKIRDVDGLEGWVLFSLLSGERTAVISPNNTGGAALPLRSSASATARVTAYLEPGVMGTVDRCNEGWCRLADPRFNGWVEQTYLWGVYPDEEF